MRRETHGRWPLLAAAGALPVSALAIRRPALRPWAALLLHQTEEWVWPGGFLPWINREVLGSREDEFPLDRRLGFAINVVLGWGSSLAAAAGPRGAAPAALLYSSNLGNVALHVSWAARNRRYDPGVVTAVATLAPTGVAGLRSLSSDERVPRSAVWSGIAAGCAASVLLPQLLRRRVRGKARR
ncbi:MAG TPA: HXXEE domain-containing protein [Solirubrobacteraceae bacterium]|nr:HXXEE domain-containing protein [Solirubrobacteraceae bacterium]